MTLSTEIDVDTFAARRSGAYMIDVREPDEYVAGHVPGAELMPLGSLPLHTGDLPRGRTVHVICASGNRSLRAVQALARAGIDAVSVTGGTTAWVRSGRPVITGTRPS
jgi:rhodanese-related sulfurtransferase